ncbi:MerR family transcriptional regulator [Paraliobacillus sp. JSM ZJ581]|uniref:MerR family transcriptional regulator n=1 Tax=Paraliobacillus sp. JSM ZJ581 TaxID=3342118 RepID=UPI0035A95C8E
MDKLFRTGDVAKLHDVTSDTVRFYDKEGLVTPTIKKQKYRYYDLNATTLFSIVTLLREMKMPIQSIKELIYTEDYNQILKKLSNHTQSLIEQKEQLERKINYLNEFNKNLDVFEKKPNTFELINQISLYLCEGQSFSLEGVVNDYDACGNYVDDQLWNRTSLIIKLNNRINTNSKIEDKYYCGNIMDSECNETKVIHLNNILKFNYVGAIDENSKYLEAIFEKALAYCKLNSLIIDTIAPVYELFIMSHKVDDTDKHYISVFFQLQTN